MRNRMDPAKTPNLGALIFAVLCLVTACASLPQSELTAIGSKITPTSANFGDLYAYAERSKAAYGTESDIRSKYPATVRIASPDNTDVQYFLEQDDTKRMQRISVRGTVDKKNWSEDLDIAIREDRKLDIPVHAGFDLAANAIYTDVKPYLKRGYKTYVTGHSLGGAVAALLTIYLMEDGFAVERVVTFGQPRFTTAAGVARLSALPLMRIIDENDIVPLVPPSTGTIHPTGPYDHVGPEIILLDGPDYVFLPSHDATRIDLGEFWRSIGLADVKDHSIDKYLERLSMKLKGATEVAYDKRERYVSRAGVIRTRPQS